MTGHFSTNSDRNFIIQNHFAVEEQHVQALPHKAMVYK